MFLRILAILGAIAAAVMFYLIGDTKDQLEADLDSTESELTDTRGQLNTATEEREELQEEVESLSEDLRETQARATNLDNQLTRVRQELREATQTISDREEETEDLRAEATRIRRELLAERTRAGELEETLEEEDVAELRSSIQQLERQLLETERQIQTADESSASAQEEGDQTRRQAIRGQVTEVGPQSAFIMLNIGREDGVRENSTVMIRRGPQYIGRATISRVQDDAAMAEIRSGTEEVRSGDIATTLN